MTGNKDFEANEHGNVPGPGSAPRADEASRVRPGEAISDKDQRVGKKIKEVEPSDAEPGYANNDNLPNR